MTREIMRRRHIHGGSSRSMDLAPGYGGSAAAGADEPEGEPWGEPD
jgi:hypothetical protein